MEVRIGPLASVIELSFVFFANQAVLIFDDNAATEKR